MTNIIIKNVYNDVDNTYKSLSNLINNNNSVILVADKESCTAILNQTDYQNKVNNMINEDIIERKYIQTVKNTHKTFQRFSLLEFEQTLVIWEYVSKIKSTS